MEYVTRKYGMNVSFEFVNVNDSGFTKLIFANSSNDMTTGNAAGSSMSRSETD